MIHVTGVSSGDSECWIFVVSDDEYRRLVGEDKYGEEVAERKRTYDEEVSMGFCRTPFRHDKWSLYPCDLLRLAGHDDSDGNITIRLSVDKV